MRPAHSTEDFGGLFPREDNRQAARRLRPHDAIEPRKIDGEDLAIEEEERALGLVLRRCSHVEIDREMREKALDVAGPEFTGIATIVETDIPSNPVDVGLLGAQAVVLEADALADAHEETVAVGARSLIHVDRMYEICRGL